MGEIILHNNGVYNLYSTISDRLRFSSGLTKEQLEVFIKDQYGQQGIDVLPKRLERVHKNGTSETGAQSIGDTLRCNHAGKNESYLSTQQIIKEFLTLPDSEGRCLRCNTICRIKNGTVCQKCGGIVRSSNIETNQGD